MYNCIFTPNQYIEVGSGDRLPILKRGKKKCTIIQKNEKKLHINLHKVYYVPKLWYNLFSLMEALRHGWKLGNKGINITITTKKKNITFDQMLKCPTGHLNGIKIQASDAYSFVSRELKRVKLFLNDGHAKLMHTTDEIVKMTAKRLNWELLQDDDKNCVDCVKGKSKQKKIAKTTESKATKTGERLYIDISSVNIESYGGSRYWTIVVDDYSNYKWYVFMTKKSDLKFKILPIIKELKSKETICRQNQM